MAAHEVSTTGKSLIAVLLLTRSRPGPNLVFHYPPHASLPLNGGGVENGSDPSEDSESDFEDATLPSPLRPRLANGSQPKGGPTSQVANATNGQLPVGRGVFGFTEDSIEKLLSPGCWCDRKKFEVCLDGITFVGRPMYAAQDGSWAKRHTHEATSRRPEELPTTPKAAKWRSEEYGDDAQTELGITITEPKTPAKPVQDFTHVPESLESRGGMSLATSMNSVSTASAVAAEQLMSFHVVLALGASKSKDHHVDALDLYHHIARTLSKALHHCQKQTSYVGVQSKKLMALKTKAKQDRLSTAGLCSQMLETSELAWALKEVYENVSVGAVARVRLDGSEISLQTPSQTNDGEGEQELDRHSGLLLLGDKDILLGELAHPETSLLVKFIRGHTPTKSLQKLAMKLSSPVNNVLYIAHHLIKWKKARAIFPLHPRNIYIPGPDAPLAQLNDHIADYARTFSALPSLLQVLEVLSKKPVRYVMLIPSREHREPYMRILAYLVQHKFVEQLKTSGWLQAPASPRKVVTEATVNKNKRPLSVASLLSPQLRPVDDDAASVSSERTAIPVSVADVAKAPVDSAANDASNESEAFTIIRDPVNPCAVDAAHLEHIRLSIADAELRDRLASLYRYFNGEAVLEEIAALEGLKRSKLDTWLEQLQEDGFLVTFRHL